MASKAWKNLERKVAKLLGGVRIVRPSYSVPAPDVITPLFSVECKYRKSFGFKKDWWEQTEANAKRSGRIPLLVFKNAGKQDEFAVLKLSHFAKLLEGVNVDGEEKEMVER